MAQQPSSTLAPPPPQDVEPRKRKLTCEIPGMDDISCMKCDDDCPVPRYFQCGHLFCLDCVHNEVKHSPSPEILSCPMCRAITTMPDGGWDNLTKEAPTEDAGQTAIDTQDTNDEDFADQYNLDIDDDDQGREYRDDDLDYDIETVANMNGGPGNEASKEATENGDENTEDNVEEQKVDDGKEDEDVKEDENGDEKGDEKGEEVKDTEDADVEDETLGNTSTEQASKEYDAKDIARTTKLCTKHQEPLVKNRCKTCRTIESRVKKMDKIVGSKVQLCDRFFQDINQLQTAIHISMDKVKGEIQERSRQLIVEIQKLEQHELSLLQQHREQRIEKLRGCGQTLMEVAKGIRDELGAVQDRVEETQDVEFNDNMKELRKACQRKIPHPDQKLKLIAFVAGKEDRLSEVFGKIDEKPKE